MSDALTAILIASGVSVAVSVFMRLMPKQKLADILEPKGVLIGKALSVILKGWLKRSAEKVEEGIIVTGIYGLVKFLLAIEKGILSDNDGEKE